VLVIGVSQTVAALQLPRGKSGSPRPFGPRDDDFIRLSLATATPVSFHTERCPGRVSFLARLRQAAYDAADEMTGSAGRDDGISDLA